MDAKPRLDLNQDVEEEEEETENKRSWLHMRSDKGDNTVPMCAAMNVRRHKVVGAPGVRWRGSWVPTILHEHSKLAEPNMDHKKLVQVGVMFRTHC